MKPDRSCAEPALGVIRLVLDAGALAPRGELRADLLRQQRRDLVPARDVGSLLSLESVVKAIAICCHQPHCRRREMDRQ
jgi:hypothetical protein